MPVTYNRLNVGADLPDGEYMPLEAFNIPVTLGLTGAFFMADGASIAPINMANGTDGNLYGNASIDDGALILEDRGFIDTGLAETQAASVVMILRKENLADNAGYFGNYMGGGGSGLSLYSSASVASLAVAVQKTSGPITASIAGTLTDWTMVAVSVPATGAVTVYNLTTAASATHVNTDARAAPNGANLLIGAFPVADGAFRSPVGAALCLVYNRALTALEIGDVGDWARAYAAARGITV